MYYALFTAYEVFLNGRKNQLKNMMTRIVSRPSSDNKRVIADMNFVKGSPFNLAGTNITSLYGGWVTRD